MIDLVCPNCKHILKVAEKHIGLSGRCNKCGARITISAPEQTGPEEQAGGDDCGEEVAALRPLRSFFSKVAGVTYSNPDRTSRQRIIERCRWGERLQLVREPENPYSPTGNATKVCRRNGEQIGYLPHDIAEEIAPRLDKGSKCDVVIGSIVSGGGGILRKPTLGVRIKITKYSLPKKPRKKRVKGQPALPYEPEKEASQETVHQVEERLARIQDPNGGVKDLHFVLHTIIEENYRDREDDPGAVARAVNACLRQIEISKNVAAWMRREYGSAPLPKHMGYERLAIIREKQEEYNKALNACGRALREGWGGTWEKRIERLRKKMDKARKTAGL